jgi:L-rhamnose mutarotase
MKRMGLCNRLRPEKAEEYKRLHADAWPGVLTTISACNIRNFSIFMRARPDAFCGRNVSASLVVILAQRETWLTSSRIGVTSPRGRST